MTEHLYRTRIAQKLEAGFAPIFLEIKDDSARHAGHAGHDPKGETHFIVTIVSAAFTGLTPVARHRLVYDALKMEMKEHVHALNLKTMAPEEYNPK